MSTTDISSTETKFNWPLLALGVGSFGIGTTEFAPMGLLPDIADGVGISIPAAGSLVTAYAIGVMVGAPLITLLFSRFGKRTALILLMGIFILGNLISATAPGYFTLMFGRVVTSLCQGAFFGFGAVVATRVVPKEKQASAVATMFMGLSIANIVGVPVATWIGQNFGWRLAFAGIVLLGAVSLVALALALPKGETGQRPDVRSELRALISPEMLLAMGITVMFASAFFALYTYVSPMLQRSAGASGGLITIVLALIGVGLTIGNWLGGRLADWSLDSATVIGLGALAAMMLAMPVLVTTLVGAAIALTVWAIAAFIVVPPLQIRAMRAAANAPSLAASINIAGFNLGNAVGASVGGSVISFGLGYSAVSIAGGLMAIVGLGLLGYGRYRTRKVSLQSLEACGLV